MLAFKISSILDLFLISSKYFSSQRNSLRRWIKYTFLTIPERYKASSKAELPPPTTATEEPLKKLPSQVAQ